MAISEHFLEMTAQGLYCSPANAYLDPKYPVINAVISHAHADHAVPGNTNVYCTAPTKSFMDLRYKKQSGGQFFVYGYRESFMLGAVRFSFYSAGHILGSAMVLMEYEGVKYLYTGDYKLQANPTCEPIDLIPADVLITESTFAKPGTAHPDIAQQMQALNNHDHNILLGAYSLGKAQRMISLLNQYCPQKQIRVHHSVLAINRIYENYGYSLGKYSPYDRKEMKHATGNMVYIVPPVTFNSYFKAINVLRVFASGWKDLQKHNDLELLISDHADWHDILLSVTTVNPSEIWTLHGDGSYLREHFLDDIRVRVLN